MMAAVRSPATCWSAVMSLRGTKWTPVSSGSKSRRYFSWPVMESAPKVRPWNEFSSEMNSILSGLDFAAVGRAPF